MAENTFADPQCSAKNKKATVVSNPAATEKQMDERASNYAMDTDETD